MEPWINVALKAPPVLTTQLNKKTDVPGLRHACNNIIRVLNKQSPLHREGALLSRFVYKYDKKFRNDIGYRNLRKTYASLRKYLEINLLKDVESFTTILPEKGDDFIPTRQMLEYVMCRIISFAKLMVRIYVCSKQGAVFYLDRIKRAQNHWMSLMPYALLSRVCSVCSVLLHHSTSWYSSLYPYLAKLQPKGLQFLPDGYELPRNLYEWLDLQQLDSFGKVDWEEKKTMNFELDWGDEVVDSLDNILEFANNINDEANTEEDTIIQQLNVKICPNFQYFQTSVSDKADCGEAVSRDSFQTLPTSQHQENAIKVKANIQTKSAAEKSCTLLSSFQKKIASDDKTPHYFGMVTNVKSLKDFLEKEEAFRNDGNKQSLTQHLSFMQWHTLKAALLKVGDTVLNNKKIERKLSKVWKEKCLDYT